MKLKPALNLVIAADLALSCVLVARGTEASLPLLGFLFMGNVLFLAPRHGVWTGFGIGGTIAVTGYIALCWLFPARAMSLYEEFVIPLSAPLEDALFTDSLAGDYAGGALYARPVVYAVATLVNGYESFLISLPQFALAFSGGFVSWCIAKGAKPRAGHRPAP